MRNTEILDHIEDINPLALNSWRDIKALPDFRYHRISKASQSSYDAHKAIVERRKWTVKARAVPWRW